MVLLRRAVRRVRAVNHAIGPVRPHTDLRGGAGGRARAAGERLPDSGPGDIADGPGVISRMVRAYFAEWL
ncbi:hypothetical protein QFZ64_003849 [Streptomyces sp. B3I8]|nr:hypothetical protein [Streptomyces sp. B3I8]